MVRIRLKRIGSRGRPYYRIVIADQRNAAAGRYIEQVGFYDPFPDPPQIDFDEEKTLAWLRKGAQPSEPVERMLKAKGILEKVKVTANA